MTQLVSAAGTIPYADLAASLGRRFGPTPWSMVTQPQVDAFADVTHDHQWIHVDEERASAGPFGTTIAHGYLTLSLLPFFLGQLLEVTGTSMAVNYGLDRVRFLAPVKSGSRVRGRFCLDSVAEKAPGQILMRHTATVEIDGEAKPALTAEWLGLMFG